jgi:hypothetical protein
MPTALAMTYVLRCRSRPYATTGSMVDRKRPSPWSRAHSPAPAGQPPSCGHTATYQAIHLPGSDAAQCKATSGLGKAVAQLATARRREFWISAASGLAIGLSVDPDDLVPLLPPALALAAVTAATKLLTGRYAAARDHIGRRVSSGPERRSSCAGSSPSSSLVWSARGTATSPSLVTAYVFILAIAGPFLTRLAGAPRLLR